MKELLLTYENFFNFEGVAKRKEFITFCIFGYIVASLTVLISILIVMFIGESVVVSVIIGTIMVLIIFLGIPLLSLSCRRLRDISLSPYLVFLYFIPIGNVFILVFCALVRSRENESDELKLF